MSQRSPMSDEILDRRAEIDAIDQQLLDLLNARARAALAIGACKRAAGIPVYDRKREGEVLARLRAANPGPLGDLAVERIFGRIIHESRMLEGGLAAGTHARAGAR